MRTRSIPRLAVLQVQQQSAARILATLFFLLALFAVISPPACTHGDEIAELAQASRARLAAKIAAADSTAFRQQLSKAAPNKNLARWYAGEVEIEGRWLTLPEVAQLAANDKRLSEYRQRRQQMSNRLRSHEKMARWCHKKKLPDLASLHWLQVLRFNNTHRGALKELGLTWQNGQLLTLEAAEREKLYQKGLAKQKKKWQGKIKRLRIEIEQDKNPQVQQAARQELHQIQAPAALPALVAEFTQPAASEKIAAQRHQDFLAVLGGIDSSDAVNLLVEIAVTNTSSAVHYTAIQQLKSKSKGDCIPALLDNLAMPIEGGVQIRSVENGVVSSYSYAQEKPGGDEYTEEHESYRYVPVPRYKRMPVYRHTGKVVPAKTIPGKKYKVPITPGHGGGIYQDPSVTGCSTPIFVFGEEYLKTVQTPDRHYPSYAETKYLGDGYFENPEYASYQQETVQKSQKQARNHAANLRQRNQGIRRHNQRVAQVLTEITGQPLDEAPKSWWTWWGEHLKNNPGVATQGARQHLNSALLNQQQRGLSRGTWVWTRQGKLPIETLLPGDFVLAQNPRTGELAFKVILAIKTPVAMQVSKLDINDSELHCSPSHVVWVTGTGWKPASQLVAGQSLHGATSESRFQQVQPAFEIATYDLVVEGFHTFFAGNQGTLVHDASPIYPTPAALPGLSSAAIAIAADLAVKR